jgi:hypothetical protein
MKKGVRENGRDKDKNKGQGGEVGTLCNPLTRGRFRQETWAVALIPDQAANTAARPVFAALTDGSDWREVGEAGPPHLIQFRKPV